MFTRILSVFNLLKRVGFALLLLGGGVFAQEVIWVRNGDIEDEHFGGSVYPLGDQNDDELVDWAVTSREGFYFYHGGSPPSQTPYLIFRNRQNPTQVMHNYRTIGDINGDGYEDWWIFYWEPGSDSVALELYGGGPNADTIPEQTIQLDYAVGDDRGDRIGDHNGDGFDDFYYFRWDLDVATFYLGSADWDTIPDFTNRGEPIGSQDDLPTQNVYGDFNGDGFDDYFARRNGDPTHVYFGSVELDTIPDITWEGNFAFPATLSADLNGDGTKDLAVGQTATIDLHLGNVAPSETPTFILNFPGCPEGNVNELFSAGDYNNDGFDDLVGISRACENGFGVLQLYLGGFWVNSDPVLRIEGLSAPPFDDVPIWRAHGLGDVNGDSIEDLAVACQGDILDGRRGRVIILSGDTTLHVDADEHAPIAQDFSLSAFPNPFNSTTRITLSLPPHIHHAELRVHNLLGQEVMSQQIGAESGRAEFVLDGAGLATGVYLVSARAGGMVAVRKVMVLK